MAQLIHLDIDRTRRRRDHRPPLEGRHHDHRLAQTISVPARNINEIVHGKSLISPDAALRLSRAPGTSDPALDGPPQAGTTSTPPSRIMATRSIGSCRSSARNSGRFRPRNLFSVPSRSPFHKVPRACRNVDPKSVIGVLDGSFRLNEPLHRIQRLHDDCSR